MASPGSHEASYDIISGVRQSLLLHWSKASHGAPQSQGEMKQGRVTGRCGSSAAASAERSLQAKGETSPGRHRSPDLDPQRMSVPEPLPQRNAFMLLKKKLVGEILCKFQTWTNEGTRQKYCKPCFSFTVFEQYLAKNKKLHI